jgi:hypothetical protein
LDIPVRIVLADDVQDVALLERQSGLSARNVLVLARVVVEEGAEAQAGLADQRLVLVRDQLERDRALSGLLSKRRKRGL